ncbi:MAG: adenylate/guanylate cyclase domain-containing protein, partial [Chthoniobacterales bacterium]
MSDLQANLHLEIAHILFIDVVGYSKLLINEQSEAIRTLNQIVLQTAQVRTAEAARQLIRLATGDGLALVFRNHPEAPAECALEIAKALRAHPQVQVRMGVHSGPVNEITDVNARVNIAGAGMNIAQRLMDGGDAGHILLSKRVADDLGQFREWQSLLHDLGEVEVKHGVIIPIVNLYREDAGNPATPEKLRVSQQQHTRATRRQRLSLAALALLVAGGFGLAQWYFTHREPPPAPQAIATKPKIPAKSIAVLPLENFSDDKANAFFADGIQDDLLASLAKIKDLKVISRTSVMSYRDKATRNLKQIGRELGVANVLEGSVRRVADRVLLNVQLIDTATDQHIWAERYDRTLADSITLQGELASEIARALQSTLSPQEKARVETKPTDNPDAYVAYLRGREVQLRPETSRENYLSAIEFYRQAIALDPKFVLARARLSFMQGILYTFFDSTDKTLLEQARANAAESLRLDNNSAEAHLASARCASIAKDDATTRRELEAVLRLNPNDANLTMQVAITQNQQGWNKEAAATYQRAAELGPREPKVFYNYG